MTPTCAVNAIVLPVKFLDRRLFPRRRARGIVRCRPANKPFHRPIRARLLDISQGGVGIQTTEDIAVNAMLELQLESAAGVFQVVRQAEVRWVTRESDGRYRLGCCLEKRLTFAEMQRFV